MVVTGTKPAENGGHMEDHREQAKGTGEMVRSLFLLLILAGLGIGALGSMEIHGRQRRAGLMADNHDLQSRLAFVEARQGEILSFMGRPQTELVKLAGAGEWSGQALTVAWNPVQRMAMVLLDRLPEGGEGMAYHLRAVPTKGAGVELGELKAAGSGERVYSVPGSVGEGFGFAVTLDPVGGGGGRTVFASAGV
jgi:Anti-sigma-K factor rskA